MSRGNPVFLEGVLEGSGWPKIIHSFWGHFGVTPKWSFCEGNSTQNGLTPLEINMLHIIMEVWKMMTFLSECVICRFHANYSRVYSTKKKQGAKTHLFVSFWSWRATESATRVGILAVFWMLLADLRTVSNPIYKHAMWSRSMFKGQAWTSYQSIYIWFIYIYTYVYIYIQCSKSHVRRHWDTQIGLYIPCSSSLMDEDFETQDMFDYCCRRRARW